MLQAAERNLKGLPVRLEIFDGQALPYPDNRLDAVICQLGLMFFNDPGRGLSEFQRVLRKADGRQQVSQQRPNARSSPASEPSSLAMLPRGRRS
jgi:ubiquinone/menaquinone biosynthesis C-methylase UbiE